MSKYTVKNLNGTKDRVCTPCGSWIKHWEKKTGLTRKECSHENCNKKATDGAHVKKVGTIDNNHYIIPLCHDHNMLNDEFVIYGPLASAIQCQ